MPHVPWIRPIMVSLTASARLGAFVLSMLVPGPIRDAMASDVLADTVAEVAGEGRSVVVVLVSGPGADALVKRLERTNRDPRFQYDYTRTSDPEGNLERRVAAQPGSIGVLVSSTDGSSWRVRRHPPAPIETAPAIPPGIPEGTDATTASPNTPTTPLASSSEVQAASAEDTDSKVTILLLAMGFAPKESKVLPMETGAEVRVAPHTSVGGTAGYNHLKIEDVSVSTFVVTGRVRQYLFGTYDKGNFIGAELGLGVLRESATWGPDDHKEVVSFRSLQFAPVVGGKLTLDPGLAMDAGLGYMWSRSDLLFSNGREVLDKEDPIKAKGLVLFLNLGWTL